MSADVRQITNLADLHALEKEGLKTNTIYVTPIGELEWYMGKFYYSNTTALVGDALLNKLYTLQDVEKFNDLLLKDDHADGRVRLSGTAGFIAVHNLFVRHGITHEKVGIFFGVLGSYASWGQADDLSYDFSFGVGRGGKHWIEVEVNPANRFTYNFGVTLVMEKTIDSEEAYNVTSCGGNS